MNDFIPPAKPIIGDEEREAVDRVLRSGMIAQGPEVKAFEEEFSEHFGLGRACVAVNSGTSGLHLGLLSSGIGPGDEVIVPSFTFAATANSVALTGATPVFADIALDDFTLDPASVEASITDKTKAIMPVHLYGHPAKMAELQAIADKHGLMLFEDAAQAHGASLNGTPVGAFGTFAMFSLYPTKNMTSGEGGMVSAANDEIAHTIADNPELEGMGTTVTAIMRARNKLILAHIGDSRAYLQRAGRLAQITKDHSFVQTLIDEGRITEEEASTHPQRSVVTRVLTGSEGDEPDLGARESRLGDRYLLCSDGLSGFVALDTIVLH